jgi:subtilisin family serine protease
MGDTTLRTLLEGIAWAVEQDADIINMSRGFSYYEPYFAEVFRLLLDNYGILPVVAVGNENHGNTSSPGSAYNALSVGALERSPEGLRVAFYSSGASLVFPARSVAAVQPELDQILARTLEPRRAPTIARRAFRSLFSDDPPGCGH